MPTEGKWGDLTTGVRGLQTRIERLTGDHAVLCDTMRESFYGPTVAGWASELERINVEMADMLEQINRLIGPPASAEMSEVDESADTDVIALADVAEDE